jgi:hypothetical protein
MSAGPSWSTLPATTAATLRTMPVARLRALAALVGGAAGALARAGAEQALPARPGQWPWATFAINLLGSLALAWLTTRLTEIVAPTRYVRFLLVSTDLPLLPMAVDARLRIEAAVDEVDGAVARGLVTLEIARLASGADVAAVHRRPG